MFVYWDVGKKVRVISVRLDSQFFQHGFQDGFIAATIIQSGLDFIGLKKINFFLKHADIPFVLQTVFMAPVAFDLFLPGDMKVCGNGYSPAL
jgi:hypothetical protein